MDVWAEESGAGVPEPEGGAAIPNAEGVSLALLRLRSAGVFLDFGA